MTTLPPHRRHRHRQRPTNPTTHTHPTHHKQRTTKDLHTPPHHPHPNTCTTPQPQPPPTVTNHNQHPHKTPTTTHPPTNTTVTWQLSDRDCLTLLSRAGPTSPSNPRPNTPQTQPCNDTAAQTPQTAPECSRVPTRRKWPRSIEVPGTILILPGVYAPPVEEILDQVTGPRRNRGAGKKSFDDCPDLVLGSDPQAAQ